MFLMFLMFLVMFLMFLVMFLMFLFTHWSLNPGARIYFFVAKVYRILANIAYGRG